MVLEHPPMALQEAKVCTHVFVTSMVTTTWEQSEPISIIIEGGAR
jgi:hypothetical protein